MAKIWPNRKDPSEASEFSISQPSIRHGEVMNMYNFFLKKFFSSIVYDYFFFQRQRKQQHFGQFIVQNGALCQQLGSFG